MNKPKHKTKDVYVNEEIVSKTVRLIDEQGQQAGLFPTHTAIKKARNEQLDLVQITPGEPAICTITDAGKYMFDRKKKLREASRHQRELTVETKEIQLRPVTEDHDLKVKAKRAKEFLEEGDKVKIVVRFRGRERAHKEIANKVVDEFLAAIGEHKVDRPLQDNGRDMHMYLAPIKTKSEIFKEKHNQKS